MFVGRAGARNRGQFGCLNGRFGLVDGPFT